MTEHKKIVHLTRTAILIAATVSLQALTLPFGNQILTGTVVNTMLILSVMLFGLTAGIAVGAVTPVLPTLFGFGPLWPVVPFIILGNMALLTVWHFAGGIRLHKEQAEPPARLINVSHIIALVIGALAKFGVLYTGVVLVAAPFILGVPEGHPITIMFSYPQLITASTGGVCAIVLLPTLKKALSQTRE